MSIAKVFVLLLLALRISPNSALAAESGAKPSYDEKAVADFYRGKTVRIIVGASAGAASDLYARVVAQHLPAPPGHQRETGTERRRRRDRRRRPSPQSRTHRRAKRARFADRAVQKVPKRVEPRAACRAGQVDLGGGRLAVRAQG